MTILVGEDIDSQKSVKQTVHARSSALSSTGAALGALAQAQRAEVGMRRDALSHAFLRLVLESLVAHLRVGLDDQHEDARHGEQREPGLMKRSTRLGEARRSIVP